MTAEVWAVYPGGVCHRVGGYPSLRVALGASRAMELATGGMHVTRALVDGLPLTIINAGVTAVAGGTGILAHEPAWPDEPAIDPPRD